MPDNDLVVGGIIPEIKVKNVKFSVAGTTVNVALELEGISESQLQQTMMLLNLILALTKK